MQRRALVEGAAVDALHGAGQVDVLELLAVAEGILMNRGDALGQRDGLERGAGVETGARHLGG